MKIYYKKNNINNFENICDKVNNVEENYEFEIKDKIYINKNYKKDAISKKEFEIEKNKFFLVKKRSKNNILFKSFFIEYILITECDNNFVIVMEKLNEHKLDSYFLKNINNDEKNNLLFQVLINIYDMNHYNKLFFNNNYDIDKNIIILNNNEKRNIEYVFNDNVKLIVPINKYKIKFNDYSKINTYPEFKTTQYMDKYFNELYTKNIISESILFTFFYFIDCGLDKNNVLLLINKIISIILKNNEINNENEKNIDYLFIYYLSIYLSSRPNFYNI